MLRIINGRVYDPTNGKNGPIEDIWVEEGKSSQRPR